jgi:selenophosphate synthetase-related protein
MFISEIELIMKSQTIDKVRWGKLYLKSKYLYTYNNISTNSVEHIIDNPIDASG